MAGKLRDDQIRWILSLDAKGVQGELVQVSSAIGQLKEKNSDLEKEMKKAERAMNEAEKAMIRLEEAGKTNTKQYEYAKEAYLSNSTAVVELKSKIEQNNKAIEEEKAKFELLTKTMQVGDMTMNQLRQRASDLQKQLNMTSASTDPEAYKKTSKRTRTGKRPDVRCSKHRKRPVKSICLHAQSGWKRCACCTGFWSVVEITVSQSGCCSNFCHCSHFHGFERNDFKE
jgi:chromosome segregation ATPase